MPVRPATRGVATGRFSEWNGASTANPIQRAVSRRGVQTAIEITAYVIRSAFQRPGASATEPIRIFRRDIL
jgi:hypothetical protein